MSESKKTRWIIHGLAILNALLLVGVLIVVGMWAFSSPAWLELFGYDFHKESLFIGLLVGMSVTTTVKYDE